MSTENIKVPANVGLTIDLQPNARLTISTGVPIAQTYQIIRTDDGGIRILTVNGFLVLEPQTPSSVKVTARAPR